MSAPPIAGERSPKSGAPGASERLFHLLLRAYPAPFRATYGREMTLLFNDQRRDAATGTATGTGFWTSLLWDVARSAPEAHAEAFRSRRAGRTPYEREGKMGPMSMLALLVGTLEIVNALIEARLGWSAGGAAWMSSVTAALLAGALLAAAGIALLRRAPGAGTLARTSAVLCIVVFAAGGLLHPWMSIFARLLGIGFPVALLLFLPSANTRGPSAPVVS